MDDQEKEIEKESQDTQSYLIPIEDAVEILLRPYEPVKEDAEADKRFTTTEIIAALEKHYGVPQGSLDYHTPKAGIIVMQKLSGLGFLYANIGDLSLVWIMRKKR